MKSLKYIIASFVLAFGFAVPAMNAQDAAPKGRQGGRPDMTAIWLKDITLTADQQAKVNAIKTDTQKQLQDIPQGGRAKMREVSQASQKKIREVLTAEQQTKFDENVKAAQQRNPGKGTGKDDKGGRSPGKRPAKSGAE